MRCIPAFALAVQLAATPTPVPGTTRPGDGQAPIATDSGGPGPGNAVRAHALHQDVASSYNQMEKSIELQFAKLKKQVKDDIDALESKIKEIDRQIAALKEQARNIQLVAAKMEELLPKLMAGLGSDSGGMRRTPPNGGQIAALLASERAKAGLPATPGFPNLTPADLSTASSLKGSNAAAFLSNRINQQASSKIAGIDGAIAAKRKEIAALKTQVAEREKQLAKIEADRQKAIARIPTPVPAKP
jgi:septal ring factor EnvC (AmiA/AmiB activator)